MRPTLTKQFLVPAILALLALGLLALWLVPKTDPRLLLRVPGTDRAPGRESGTGGNPVLAGRLITSDGVPGNLPGDWPRFRGANCDGISTETNHLAHSWQTSGPRELWGVDLGEGYAGAVIRNGRVYLMDYDREKKQDALRCLSFSDGRELWRYAYPVAVKRNHGMSRTVPVVTDQLVVAIGPKCHVVCVDASSGQLRWGLDMVRQFGATVPPWYAGQCPLLDNQSVILAPGGKDCLLLAVEANTGKPVWQTPNPHGWKMTHSSIMPLEFQGERMFVYCANNGVVGVSATDGAIRWETGDWKISLATVPSPIVLEGGKIFLTGGYNAGSLMLQLQKDGNSIRAQTLFRLGPETFGAAQHTPIAHEGHLYGVRADGKFVCLTFEGKVAWTSDAGQTFGLGSFLMGDGLLLALNDTGLLRLIEATPEKYHLLGQAQVLKGRESWGPMALAGGRLLARDLTHLVCLDVAAH